MFAPGAEVGIGNYDAHLRGMRRISSKFGSMKAIGALDGFTRRAPRAW